MENTIEAANRQFSKPSPWAERLRHQCYEDRMKDNEVKAEQSENYLNSLPKVLWNPQDPNSEEVPWIGAGPPPLHRMTPKAREAYLKSKSNAQKPSKPARKPRAKK